MGRSPSEHKPRPIVLKLVNIETRDNLWFGKSKFKGTGITVSEFLTKHRHDTFMAARQKFGVAQSWTKEGVVYIMTSGGVWHRITNISKLNKVEQQQTEKLTTLDKPQAKSKRAVTQKKH